MFHPWTRLLTDMMLLSLEAQTVIWARWSQILTGRGSAAENMLMMSEKMTALGEAALTLATGGSAHQVVKGYRRKVRANVRRLGSRRSKA